MTENDNIKRSKGKFDPITETRDWCIANGLLKTQIGD
jgi:hypothetical protein